MSAHIPAWKRIALQKQAAAQESPEVSTNEAPKKTTTVIANNSNTTGTSTDDDPFNVTTHLATGSLTKKQKKLILTGKDLDSKSSTGNKVKKLNSDGSSKKKKEKLSKKDKILKQQNILKDPLRYLIEFYVFKIDPSIDTLPAALLELPAVVANMDSLKPQNDSQILSLWKFNKSKQTWLLKNLFQGEDEIPQEYDFLLVEYFKSLKGQSRDQLVAECVEVLQKWNTFVAEQKQEMEKLLLEDKPEEAKTAGELKEESSKAAASAPPSKQTVARAIALLKELDSDKVISLENWDEA